MSRSNVTCRPCHKRLASAHHGGAARFAWGGVPSFDPTGPHGPCLCGGEARR